ncbi:MAG TPA: hypothetical protein VK619_11075 [Pyrinomonadaceae bacterium]|nr:hypothetical protein [Pyrinomonadaceae bacterium]
MKLSQARVALLILVVLSVTPGCAVINRIRAKNELNECARAYREGHFAEAEEHAKRAAELDPTNKTAPSFVARTIHAQYKPGVDTPENQQIARNAINAYKQLLAVDPNNEEAYKAIAALLGALKQDDEQRQWILQRANQDSVDPAKRAEAFTVLASKQWDCSYKITELPDNKKNQNQNGHILIIYQKPKNADDFNTALQCATLGLEYANKAISLDPNNESAWSYKTNILLELAKLAEMDGKADQKAEYQKQANDAQNETTRLNEAKQKRQQEQQRTRPSPPAG